MTKNQTLSHVTQGYLNSLVITCASDIDKIEEELLDRVQHEFELHNAICDKSKRWPMPLTLNFAQIADILAHIFPIKRIACCPQNTEADYDLLGLYITDSNAEAYGTYVTSEDVFRKLIRRFNYSITNKESEEVMSALRDKVPRVARCTEPDLIAVNNGIFNYATKELMPFSDEYVFLTKSHVNYNPQAQNIVIHNPEDDTDWDVESWMSELSDDPEIIDLLWQIIGAIIRPNVRWNKSAWLYSERGNNGKGTLCELMRSICGNTGYASIPLSDFGKDFMLEPLTRASAIIVDENDVGTFIDKAGNLKSVITNDVIQINRKFKTPIAYQFYGFMVQCLNEYPKIRDKSDSFYRRQLFIPMTKCFTGRERKYIKNDYLHRPEVLEYVLYKVLNMNYYTLSEPESCRQVLNDYKEYNDPVRQFFDELEDEFKWDLLPFTFLYELYKAWFKINMPSGTVQGRTSFINDLLGVITQSTKWKCEGKDKKIRVTNTNMQGPEPLIVQYGVITWQNATYKGMDINKLATPSTLSQAYRGLTRIIQPAIAMTDDDTNNTNDTNNTEDNTTDNEEQDNA